MNQENAVPTPQEKSHITILLSINAVAVLVAGIAIASAIWLNGGLDFRMVDERSDIIKNDVRETKLLDSVSNSENISGKNIDYIGADDYTLITNHSFDSSAVPSGELWNETTITIYATPDIDICVGGELTDLGEMYWQTSNSEVIAGFHDSSRTWLGYDDGTCRYPVVNGTGTTIITAGTYDGKRKDSIQVTVVDPPTKQWEHEVLTLINKIRIKNNLEPLTWGYTCEMAAKLRANEAMELYSHTRPDGTSWDTACISPEDSAGISGENLAIGNAAVSPASVVSLWMDSEAHRANILNPDYTKLAVGFVFDQDSEYRTYWAQFFSTY